MSTAGGSGKVPLYRKICEEIRRDIVSGIYQPGEVLPSIRDKARTEGVARNTVDAAYQILAEEGYIRSRRGVGYVVQDLSQTFLNGTDGSGSGTACSGENDAPRTESAEAGGMSEEKLFCDFRYPVLATEHFSLKLWNSLFAAVYRETAGQPEDVGKALRMQIRKYLRKHRGITCSDEQICLCRNLFQAVQMIRRVHPHLLYVVPHHQGEFGNHISREEEDRLLSKYSSAAENDPVKGQICIVEDDIDSELVYRKRPYMPLFARDREGRVILTGTFERTLGSIMPIQYVVFPERSLRERREIFEAMGRGENHSLLEFKVMEILMRSEYWEGFLRKVNHRYADKRDLLIQSLERYFQGRALLYRTESGPELIAAVPCSKDAVSAVKAAAKMGLGISARTGPDTGVLYVTIRYAAVRDEFIERGVAVLAEAVRELQ